MLIRFIVSNFLSFNKRQEFSMISGKRIRSHKDHVIDDKKIKILKFTEVFGANAAGKSNLVESMEFARQTILSRLPYNHSRKYCRINEENREIPSLFEFEIKIGLKYYAYGFKVILSKSSIVEEWLYQIDPKKDVKPIYTRDIREKQFEPGQGLSKDLHDFLTKHGDSIKSDDQKLFLTEINRYNTDFFQANECSWELRDVYYWFVNSLDINYPNRPIGSQSYFMVDKDIESINNIISSFGLGIIEFQRKTTTLEEISHIIPGGLFPKIFEDVSDKYEQKLTHNNSEEKLKKNLSSMFIRINKEFFIMTIDPKTSQPSFQKIQFKHIAEGSMFDWSEESDGTIRMLDLLEVLFAAKNETQDKIFVIDEINRSLHPQLTYKLIENFLKTAKNNIQLIVTTHESHLLDLKMLRRDEIWFIDKNQLGESSIYSLDAFSVRFDKHIGKAYFDGRYGGIPLFDRIYPLKSEDA